MQERASREGRTVASLRDDAIEIMTDALNIYGESAAAAAADLFSDIMELEGLAIRGSMRNSIVSAEEVRRIAHYQAGKIVADNIDGFIEQMAGSTSFMTRQVANGTMMAQSALVQYNGGWHYSEARGRALWSYSSNGSGGEYQIRYARVPQGYETCDFCLMLASRGFVYLTAESAEGWNHTHRNCDCIVVAGIVHKEAGGWVQDTELEGYGLDELNSLRGMWSERARGDTEGRLEDLESVLGRPEW